MQKKKYKVIKQVYRVKKDGRLNNNLDLTHVKEKPTVEETSASSIDQIVPNSNPASNNMAEQWSSLAGGQDDLKATGTKETGLTGVQTDLTGRARNSGRAKNVTLRNKVMKKKPSFVELLHKYQKIAE